MSPPARSLAPRLSLLQEQRYRLHFLREDSRQTSIVIAVVGVAYAVSAINDFPVLHEPWLLGVSLASRGLLAVASVIVLFLLRRARWPREQDRAFHVALAASAIFMSVVHLAKIPSGQIQGPLVASATFLAVLYFAQRGPIVPRAIAGSAIVIASLALIVLGNHQAALQPLARVTTAIALTSLNVIGILSARAFEENRRRRFEAERRERHARQELAVRLRELAAEKERAQGSSRARTAFLAAMSHEFRTPMNAVIGLSDLLLDEPLAPAHSAHIRTIGSSARALLAMLNEILDFAKIDAQKVALSLAPFNLPKLATSIVNRLSPSAKARSIDLTLDLSPSVPEVLIGDEARLGQVFVNLISNAVKFTKRGSVCLEISARETSALDHEIKVRVKDTGIGMTDDVISRLFQPFEQGESGLTRRPGSTGLGLALSKQIVGAMGGDLQVETELGRGSVLSFTIQLATSAAPLEVPAPTLPAERPHLAILVVDDHPINREVAQARLGKLGYEVDLASSGQEAIEAAGKTDYDVIFMDLQMPGMSGIEATRRIGEMKAGERAPHVIALTASVFEEDREACREAGMRDFAGKPIDLVQIDALLARVAVERGAAVRPKPAHALAGIRRIQRLGEPEFLERLCRIFLTDAPKRIGRMKEALARMDAGEIAREAHTLISSSATLGAAGMSEACIQVEIAARQGRLQDLAAGIDAIAAQLVAAERTLLVELDNKPQSPLLEAK